jgi:formylglycine-generating enzyme required for sulfatase activity
MKRIGAVILGLACLTAVARAAAPAYGELNDDVFSGVKKGMKDAKAIKVGYIPANDPNAGKPSQALEWVSIPGGTFKLGTPDFDDAKPIDGKTYTIKTFEMSKTLVTVEQYAECVVKGGCTQPGTGKYCNSDKIGRALHPAPSRLLWKIEKRNLWLKKKDNHASYQLATRRLRSHEVYQARSRSYNSSRGVAVFDGRSQ